MQFIRNALHAIREWATLYQPAVARTVVAAFFQMLVGVGITVGDWPDKANAVLGFVAILATLLAGRSIQRAVDAPATVRQKVVDATVEGFARGYNHGTSQ